MFTIEIPDTVHQITGIFYRLGMWSHGDVATFGDKCRKLFYFVLFVSFVLSLAVEAYITDDNDESVSLTVLSIILVVQAYRMWIFLWQNREFLLLVHQVGLHSTNDRHEYTETTNTLNKVTKWVRYYLYFIATSSFVGSVVFPVTSKTLVFNIALPFDRNKSEIAFYLSIAFFFGGFSCASICVIFTKMIWFLMLSLSFEYKILGTQFRRMGTITKASPLEVSVAVQQKAFFDDFIVAIRKYDKINGELEEFASFFGKMFFMQVATGSISICGSVYTLAFSSHESLMQIVIYCTALLYSIFDIFMVMYLGNEIMLSSDQLSQCVYGSNWIEQSQSCKKCIIILTERLRRPQQLVAGKLYPLNLLTFTTIVNSAYSMFNILQSIR